MSRDTLSKKGFTLVELMLAMALFTTVMIISTTGFIAMNRTFTRGTIRKQLSEASQRITEQITRDVRAMPQSEGESSTCKVGPVPDTDCPSGWNALCLTGARYIWQADEDGKERGGLYRDTNDCSDAVDPSKAEKIMDDRYKTVVIGVAGVGDAKNGLYQVSGTIRTLDGEAFTNPDTAGAKCKGTALSSAVRTCAVETFGFTINARGATL